MGKGLCGVASGAPVVIDDANRGVRRTVVTKVGRKYISAGGQQFVIATGRVHDAYGHALAYTESQWERLALERRLLNATRRTERAMRDDLSKLSMEALREILAAVDMVNEKLGASGD
jgi:hypothetical protein